MAAFYGFCLALMLVMRLAPDSPLGRWLNHNIVQEPLARAAALERHHLIFLAIASVMLLAVGETIAIYGTFEWAMISAFDLSIYLDAVAVTAVFGVAARFRGVMQVLRGRGGVRARPKRAARRRRTRAGARKPPTKSANDDDPAPAFASFGFHLAAA
jgi:hypothetical protein